MIYKNSGKIDDDEIKSILNILQKKEGRYVFLRVLNEAHSDNKVQEFGKDSFNACLELFTNVLLITSNSEEKEEKNEENLIYFMKLLKISNKIYTLEKGSKNKIININLSDKIYNGLGNYPLIYTKRFWEIWLDDGLSRELLEIKKLEEKEKDKLIDNLDKYDDYKKEIVKLIISLIPIMLKMKMDENSIYSIITYVERKYINDIDAHKNIEESLLRQLKLYRLYKK